MYLDRDTWRDHDVAGSPAALLHAEVQELLVPNARGEGTKFVLLHDKRLLDQPPATFAALLDSTPRGLLTKRGEGGLVCNTSAILVRSCHMARTWGCPDVAPGAYTIRDATSQPGSPTSLAHCQLACGSPFAAISPQSRPNTV